jgi:hypothetical protein
MTTEDYQVANMDAVKELEHQIFEVLHEADSYADIFEALKGTLIFQLSTLCPSCRANIARKFECDIPQILRDANEVAQRYAEDGLPTAHDCRH